MGCGALPVLGLHESQIQSTNQSLYSEHIHDPNRASHFCTFNINSIDAAMHSTSPAPPFSSYPVLYQITLRGTASLHQTLAPPTS